MASQQKLSNSLWVGAVILLIGSVLLFDKLDLFDFPRWIFSFGSLLIAIGLVVGAQKRFQGIGWLILVLVGLFFLVDKAYGWPFEIRRLIFPIGIIIVGAFIVIRAIMGPKADVRKDFRGDGLSSSDAGGEDSFDITTIFGGTKRKVFSKKFKGGQTTCIFGGSEIDLSQADIDGTVVIDVVQVFGGVKIIMPANWQLRSDVTAVLGAVDDKRAIPSDFSSEKKVVLTGFVMFGGVDIKSF